MKKMWVVHIDIRSIIEAKEDKFHHINGEEFGKVKGALENILSESLFNVRKVKFDQMTADDIAIMFDQEVSDLFIGAFVREINKLIPRATDIYFDNYLRQCESDTKKCWNALAVEYEVLNDEPETFTGRVIF